MNDPINHPSHYTASHEGMECIDLKRDYPSSLSDAVKYVWRYQDKNNPRQDIGKAIWYLRDSINHQEPSQPTPQQAAMLIQLEADAIQKHHQPDEASFWAALHHGTTKLALISLEALQENLTPINERNQQ